MTHQTLFIFATVEGCSSRLCGVAVETMTIKTARES
jgi:hypothetical protein